MNYSISVKKYICLLILVPASRLSNEWTPNVFKDAGPTYA